MYQHKTINPPKPATKNTVLWLTGLPGSGKSTIANLLANELTFYHYKTCVLDGDQLRENICADLDYSDAGRTENIRRIAQLAKQISQSGIITIAALITPFHQHRIQVRHLTQGLTLIDVYCKADIAVCEKRDPKGHYAKARRGDIQNFTGIGSRYEIPNDTTLTIDTTTKPKACVSQIINYLQKQNIISLPPNDSTQ